MHKIVLISGSIDIINQKYMESNEKKSLVLFILSCGNNDGGKAISNISKR